MRRIISATVAQLLTEAFGWSTITFVVDRWTSEQLWPDGNTGPLVLRLTFALVDERPQVVGVELWAAPPTTDPLLLQPKARGAVHSEDLRAIPLRRLLADWQAGVARTAVFAEHNPGARRLGHEFRRQAIEMARVVGTSKRKGGADIHPPEHWRAVADVYLRSGTKGVATTWGVSPGTAGRWVWVARNEKGLLDRTSPGRTSGRATRERNEDEQAR